RLYKSTSIILTATDGTNTATADISTWSKNTWHHIVTTWDDTNFLELYTDSTAGTGSAAYNPPTLTTNLYLGQDNSNGALANATITDLMIYSDRLTSTQITDLYSQGLSSLSLEFAPLDAFA